LLIGLLYASFLWACEFMFERVHNSCHTTKTVTMTTTTTHKHKAMLLQLMMMMMMWCVYRRLWSGFRAS